ncbi:hypothetical protein ACQHIV_42290 (plasmid) [Kribbella sp. GL6]|uniref:hypothetical protein n=1 Tax=Kribbella sp. GL6 TaxID=3419765 RepID=UPI003CFF36C6
MSTPKTYRDHGATGPQADLPVWDDTTDHGRITRTLYATNWPTDVSVTLAGYITAQSLQASEHGIHDGPSADTSAGIARALLDLEAELARRADAGMVRP